MLKYPKNGGIFVPFKNAPRCNFLKTPDLLNGAKMKWLSGMPYLCIVREFKKYYVVPAPPEEVYLALTLPATIQLWTGEKAEMSTAPGSEFSLWDGSIVGKNIEFEDGKKIVQHWYFGDQVPDSIVTLKLHSHPAGTSVEVRQTNIPDDDFEEISDGWTSPYMSSLIDFYED
jgi:activator of HSP90 ATPase